MSPLMRHLKSAVVHQKNNMARKNKSKKEIVSDIQLVKDADRRRALIKDVVYTYLVDMDDTIGYSKVFMQAFSGLVNGIFDERRKTTTLGQMNDRLIEKLNEVFNVKDAEQKKEFDRYVKFVDLLKDISVQDLTYATELPRYIDGFLLRKTDKNSIKEIPIDEILGK